MSNQNKLRKLENKKSELVRKLQLCEHYKEKIVRFVQELNNQHNKGLISYKEYYHKLNKALDQKTPEQWIQEYDGSIWYYKHSLDSCEREIKKQENKAKIVPLVTILAVFMILGFGFLFLKPTITGLIIGIDASPIDITLEPGLEKTIQLRIVNDGHKDFDALVYAEGDLAEYITIDEPMIKLTKDQDSKIIFYNIKLPKSFEKKGVYSANIVIRQIPNETDDNTKVTASIAVASVLKVTIPYEGKYAEIRLFAPRCKQGKESNFSIEVMNLGTEKILEAQTVIEVYNPLKNKVATITSNKVSIKSKEEKLLTASWTPDIGSGNYNAVATLTYDELSTKSEKSFTVGELLPEIISINVDNFKLGGIAKFDILVKNNLNEELKNVFAETAVKDKKGEIYTSFETISLDIPAFGKQEFNVYWDTSKVIPGTYNLDIILNYLGERTENIFEIFVEYDKIKVPIIGKATEALEEKPGLLKSVNNLTFIVIISIIVNVIIIIIFKMIARSKTINKS